MNSVPRSGPCEGRDRRRAIVPQRSIPARSSKKAQTETKSRSRGARAGEGIFQALQDARAPWEERALRCRRAGGGEVTDRLPASASGGPQCLLSLQELAGGWCTWPSECLQGG